MTTYINAGAKHTTGARVKTKAELKRTLKATPDAVTFDPTDAFTASGPVLASELDNRPRKADEVWQIVGPDPHTDRRWYASVRVVKGELKVT